jgi:lipooligosaccharide transport system ATP-binding protein
MSPPTVVEALDLSKKFGRRTAVDGVTLSVASGECFGILGPNGAGKTTTIRMIYGFSPPTGGSLRVFGLDVTREAVAVKRRIGVCQQADNLDPDLSILENLVLFASYFDIPRPAARDKALELLRFIAMEGRRDETVTGLSGGLLRRLMLARSLINDPDLVILDEPTTGLDPQSRHQVWERLEDLKRRGLTTLLTTHYMEEAARLCDRLVIMDHGRILVEGKPSELVRRYAGTTVIEVPHPTEAVREFVRGRGLDLEDLGHRLIIHAEDGEGIYREIVHRFCAGECILRMATLEDVFLKLTGRDLRE